MKIETPEIDGVSIDQIIRIGEGGMYERAEATSERELKSREVYTAYVRYHGEVTEEIDVRASDETDARTIVEVALLWHYNPGGKIVKIEGPRLGLYF